ncbi:hypothetical protein Van01_16770 [Micromonospora andamanensis]|uniref:NERD domain-containing protein n=1 Tax=Micromonospora andamanensis TaxID=1287068 RepID=A0ABQ4HS27_9ACTN|nr:hypothetical protein Van01_16770 [Micromonospora andamanensis]
MRYDEFVRCVRRFKGTGLLRLLASASASQWHRSPRFLVNAADPITPWAVSLVAREALAGGLAATGRQRATAEVLPELNRLVHELADPLTAPRQPDGGSGTGFLVRAGYQQFPYQQPVFGDTARMRPMLTRSFPRPRYQILSDQVITDLLGVDVGTYTSLAPFFLAATMNNAGLFNPAWLDLPHFAPVLAAVSKEEILRVWHTRMSAPAGQLRALARSGRNLRSELRQYDFNPLADRPFVVLPDGNGLAPQPLFVVGRFSMAALYYAGRDRYGPAFADDLGHVNEEYALEQLTELTEIGAKVTGEIESGNAKKIDGFVVFPEQVILIEVKSLRPTVPSRLDFTSYTRMLDGGLARARTQLRDTYERWRGGHPAFAHLPVDRPVRGLIVVPEPLYLANHSMFAPATSQMPFPTAVVSLTELEQLVAAAVAERSGRVFTELNTDSPHLTADATAALTAARARTGIVRPSNPILDASFEAIRWTRAAPRTLPPE